MIQRSVPSRPLILGHRGAPSLAPENTLAAFKKARAAGADGIEFDVQLSRDGQLVIIHDDTVDRTTDGQGAIDTKTLAELRTLDAGSWFDRQFRGERIPTLAEVFDVAGQQMLLNIEIKSKSGGVDTLASLVAACVRSAGIGRRVIISSFEAAALRQVRAIAPELRIGFLFSSPPDVAQLNELHPEALHPQWRLVDAPLVAQAHERGQQVNVWTVNEEHDLRSMVALGVDSIMSDYPQRLVQLLGPTNPRP